MFLSSGRPLVRWQAKEGLAEVHSWLDQGKDASAWIDLQIHMTEAMSMEQIQNLRRARDGFIGIRPVYPEMEQAMSEQIRVSSLPVDELFRRFYTKQTGGAEPEEELVRLFLELVRDADEDAAGTGREETA